MIPRLDLTSIQRSHPLPGIVAATVKLIRAGTEYKACCPFHADKTPSFTLYQRDGAWRWHCFGGCGDGDTFDYLMKAHGVTLPAAAEMLGAGNLPSVHVVAVPADDGIDRGVEARAIWRQAVAIAGTPAETYLRSRGLHLPIPASIRFARLKYGKRGQEHPCLVACVASVDNKIVGIQRTYLNASGTGKAAVPKPKLSLGRVSGGAIRLAPAAGGMVVCEGLEDGLTLMQEMGRAVWVAAGASMMPNMQFPAGVHSIAIGGDGDEAGREAARRAAEAYSGRRLRVRTFFPVDAKDFNDELRGKRP
ncbi:hypothetical protein BH10PSE12_BH10PSE12_36520 [soil metagenome]